MYVVLTFDEFSKLKESSKANKKLELFIDSLNNELEVKAHEIDIAKKTRSWEVIKNSSILECCLLKIFLTLL